METEIFYRADDFVAMIGHHNLTTKWKRGWCTLPGYPDCFWMKLV